MASWNTKKTLRIVYAAICLALCQVLPFFTGGIPIVGETLSPMHFPALLCGFLCGPVWGAAVGLVAPVLRFLLFGMPSPLYPKVLRMALELLTYGATAGFFYKYLPKNTVGIYSSLISAMFFGRLAWGLSWYIMTLFDANNSFVFGYVLTQTVSKTVFGILFQLILIPPIVLVLQKMRILAVK